MTFNFELRHFYYLSLQIQCMIFFYYTFVILLITLSILPKIPSSHWVFRVSDFGKIQIFYLSLITFVFAFFIPDKNIYFWICEFLLLITILFHGITLFKYTQFYPTKKLKPKHSSSQHLHFISANVYQFNKEYKRFVELINKHKPDVFLTMESNKDWENALEILEKDYPFHHKVGLENTYGIHLYSKLEINKSQTHYFVADDIPSIEAELKTKDGYKFVFFGVHPPPPSPTEEKTSKERDGDLLSVAKRVKELRLPSIVVGDFNNVAWSKSSILFRKTSELIDPRIGHGFVSSFHAKYKLLRFPIDLMFHSTDVFISELKTLENFGSDHLAVYCKFFIDAEMDHHQEEQVETATQEEMQEANEMIIEGKKEESNREEVVTED